jgi:hypothetical protein
MQALRRFMKSAAELQQNMLKPVFMGEQRMLQGVSALLVLIGAAFFIAGISGPQACRVWQAYLVNYLFWSGISFSAVLFAAIINMTSARWAWPLKRIAEAPGAFLPLAFALFWVLYAGRYELFPWIHTPVEEKAVWLNAGFMFARNGAGLLLLTSVSMALIYFSVRNDISASATEMSRDWRMQTILSPILAILFALVLTLSAFDLVMSLDPHWYSTLFGAYYFIGSFYSALAALVFLVGLARGTAGMERYLGDQQFHDLGKLLFAFCMVTGYLFFAQFLVIWYGNLPEETRYVILRVVSTPWEPVAWTVLTAIFCIPFVVLLSRKIKMKIGPMMVISILILAGMWLERFILVAPSLWKQQGIPLGLPELAITGGFLGAMAWSIILFFKKVPLLPLAAPLFPAAAEEQMEQEITMSSPHD